MGALGPCSRVRRRERARDSLEGHHGAMDAKGGCATLGLDPLASRYSSRAGGGLTNHASDAPHLKTPWPGFLNRGITRRLHSEKKAHMNTNT